MVLLKKNVSGVMGQLLSLDNYSKKVIDDRNIKFRDGDVIIYCRIISVEDISDTPWSKCIFEVKKGDSIKRVTTEKLEGSDSIHELISNI